MNLATEQLIERLNLLLQHYNTATSISDKLNSLLRYLQLQLGTNKCPLDLAYDDCVYLAPLSWIKMLWRTLQVTGFQLHLKYDELPAPRQGDVVIMELAMDTGLDKDDLMSVSRVKGKLGVIFLSDMTTADGKYLEEYACDPQTPSQGQNSNSQKKNPHAKIGRCGGTSGANTQWKTSNSTRHWERGHQPHTGDGSGSMTRKTTVFKER